MRNEEKMEPRLYQEEQRRKMQKKNAEERVDKGERQLRVDI